MTPTTDPLAGFATIIRIPIAWGEMDAFAHVNNIVYFRYFESARIAYLRAIDLIGKGPGEGIGPILHSTHCRFRSPLTFPGEVRVGARAIDVAGDRFTMEYIVVNDATGVVAAEGGGVVVAYDYGKGEKCELPAAVRARIGEIDGV